jgi:hypothetical protein
MLGTLNETETAVLEELKESSEGNGHDFGFTDEITVVRSNQVSGYISQLVQKGYIVTYEQEVNGRMLNCFFEFTPEAMKEYVYSTDGGCSWCGENCAQAELPQGCWNDPGRIAYDEDPEDDTVKNLF